MTAQPRSRRAFLIVCALGLAALLLARTAWRGAGDAPAPPRQVLRLGIGAEPETLDPQTARSEAALTVLRDLYEGLTAIGPDGAAVPAAASGYELSTDARIYTFHLRPGARWSNGDPLTADDFVFAWDRLRDPSTRAPNADLLDPVLRAWAADPATLVVELKAPTAYFPGVLAHPATFPLNRRVLAQSGAHFAKPGIAVSNGAFVLARWEFGARIVARRNRAYWNDAATRLDGVDYHVLAEPAAELRAYRAGEIDITATIPPAQYAWLKAHLPGELRTAPQLAVYYLGLNLLRPPFAGRPGLRRALSMVIDRERLVQAVTGGGERPAYRFTPDGSAAGEPASPADPDFVRWPMSRRIETARRLLAADGAGGAPHIELRYNTGDLHSRIALALAAMWKEALGVETTLHAEEFKVLLQDIDRGDVTQAFRASWVGDYNDPYGFLQLLKTGAPINLPRYSSSEFDALLGAAEGEADPARRAALLTKAERRMLDDQPVIPLYFYESKHLVSPRVSGWRNNVMNVAYAKNLSLESQAYGTMPARAEPGPH